MLVAQALAQLIEGWLSRSKHNNLNVLHSKTGVSYSTVTRLAQAKIEGPQLDAIIAILPVVATEPERISFLKEFYPGLLKVIERADSYSQSSAKPSTRNQVFDELFADPIGYRLGQHILSRAGISTGKVKELFGEAGLDILKSLEAQGLAENDGKVWKTEFNYSNQTVEGNVQQAVSAARSFKVESMKASAGLLNNLSESVTLEAAQEMTKELTDCLNRLRAIRDKNPGSHVFVCSLNYYLSDAQAAIDEEASK